METNNNVVFFEEPEESYEDVQFAENKTVEEDDDQNPSSEEKRELLKKTKIVKQTWSIQEIYQKIKAKRLDLSPDYQRNVIWQTDKQTAFVESLFMGIIVPPIYVVEIPGKSLLDDSTYEVVDGKQRLTTINAFLTNKLKLDKKSLEYYKDWFGGKTYGEIIESYKEITYEMLSSVLDIYVITANSPEFTKYDIFSRLNKGAEKLKVNEIRKAIYRSHTLDIIDRFVKCNANSENGEQKARYNRLFTANDIKRYEDYGRFYTSLAFFIQSNPETHMVDKYNSRPRDMINNVLQGIQNGQIRIEDAELEIILKKTLDLMELVGDVEGKDYIINSCIPYVVSSWDSLVKHIDVIISNESILASVKKSASTTSNVNLRLAKVYDILNS
jgi:hypothetical protein